MSVERRTGSWVVRHRNESGPPFYVCRASGRDVWLDGPVNAFVWPTKKAALNALKDVRDWRKRLYVERSTAHEQHYQAERDQRERNERDDDAQRAYRRMWGA